MGMYNYLNIEITCPHCGNQINSQAEIRFGYLNLDQYKMGDAIKWGEPACGGGVRFPKSIPLDGNYIGEGYVECPVCLKDFFIDIYIKNNIFSKINYSTRDGYIKD